MVLDLASQLFILMIESLTILNRSVPGSTLPASALCLATIFAAARLSDVKPPLLLA